MNPFDQLLSQIRKAVKNIYPSAHKSEHISLTTPPDHVPADYTFSTFLLGKALNQNPADIASHIVKNFSPGKRSSIQRIHSIGPYINIEVDKDKHGKRAYKYILNNQKFGPKDESTNRSLKVSLNYFVSSNLYPHDILRIVSVGKAIANSHRYLSNEIKENLYLEDWNLKEKKWNREKLKEIKKNKRDLGMKLDLYASESQFLKAGPGIIKKALKAGAAKHIQSSKVVTTLPEPHTTASVLQRYDGSGTSFLRHLAYIESIVKKSPEKLIFICEQEQTEMLDSLLSIAKKIGLISPKTTVTITPVQTLNSDTASIPPSRALIYAILRTPLHEDLRLESRGTMLYSMIELMAKELAAQKKSSMGKEQEFYPEDFRLIKKLLNFPKEIERVASSHDPSQLCAYLEVIIEDYGNLYSKNGHKLSDAVSAVIEEGLSVLLS